MKTQEAISILMLSPCYWQMTLSERRELVREFLASYAAVTESSATTPDQKTRE